MAQGLYDVAARLSDATFAFGSIGLTCNNATHPVVLSFLCWFGIPQLTMPKQQVLCVEGWVLQHCAVLLFSGEPNVFSSLLLLQDGLVFAMSPECHFQKLTSIEGLCSQ